MGCGTGAVAVIVFVLGSIRLTPWALATQTALPPYAT